MAFDDTYWMREALLEGKKAHFIAPPNPAVGCILVKDGKEIARGHTQAPGSNHAEIEAIEAAKKAGASPKGATAYVTLEPCSHQGRTPPCATRLVKEGIARVVFAVEDPNPLVSGKGAKILRDAGVEVVSGVCEKEARIDHCGFFSRITKNRPWVRLKSAISLDGRIALNNGVSQWITGEEARSDAMRYRALSQGLLTGVGTVLADNPQMNVRVENLPSPVKFVIDSKAKTPLEAKILQGKKTVIFVGDVADATKCEALEKAGAEIVRLPIKEDGHISLKLVLEEIAKRGVNELHVEAGGQLSGAMLEAGLVDELLIYVAPKFLGPGMPLAQLKEKTTLNTTESWNFVSVDAVGKDRRLVLRKELIE